MILCLNDAAAAVRRKRGGCGCPCQTVIPCNWAIPPKNGDGPSQVGALPATRGKDHLSTLMNSLLRYFRIKTRIRCGITKAIPFPGFTEELYTSGLVGEMHR